MKRMKHMLPAGALLLAIGAGAATYTVQKLAVRPTTRVYMPISNDTVDTRGKKFDLGTLLGQRGDLDFTRGTVNEIAMDKDSTFTFAKPAKGQEMYVAQTTIRPDEFFTGKLTVCCNTPFAVLLDGKEKASKTTWQDTISQSKSSKTVDLKIEPEVSVAVTVRLLACDTAAAPVLRMKIEPDKKSEAVSLAIGPMLKNRFMLAQTDQGEKVTSTAMSPDGKYTLLRYFTRLDDQKTSWRYEIIGNQTGSVVARPSSFGGWMPKGCAYYFTRKTDDGYDLYRVAVPSNEEKLLAQGLPESSFTWSPNEEYIVYYDQQKEDLGNSPLRRYASPDDRIKGNRNRYSLKLYDLRSGIEQPLTFGTKSASLQDISRDGSKLLFLVNRETPTKYPFYAASLVQLTLDGMRADTLIADNGYLSGASYSPDAKTLMLLGSPRLFGDLGLNIGSQPVPNDFDTQLYLYDPATKQATAPLKNFNPSVARAEWNPADGQIYMLVNEGFCRPIYKLNPKNGKISTVPVEVQNVGNFSVGDGETTYLSYTGQGDTYAGRAFILNQRTAKARMVADPFAKTLSKIELGQTNSWNFTARDGSLIEGTITTPPDFDPNKKYPLLVYYYGGTSPSQHGLTHPYVPQLYASRGYVVYVLNPSGTYGYGQEFSARHVNAWGKQTADDIIEGVKLFCKEHPFVNEKKIGCFGASYGGFMTQYLLTQTDIFAAAMSHAGISNVTSYWGEGYWGYSYNSVAAAESYPWTNPELFTKQGSLFNADKIHTPLLLMHGTADTNVPIGESIQLFNALSILGRQVEFISVDGGDHTSGSFSYDKRLLWHRTVMAWFDRWLRDNPRWWEEMYPTPNL